MTTATTPIAVESDVICSVSDLLEERLRTAPDHVAFLRRTGEGLVEVTTREFCRAVRRLASGLIARGIAAGDNVAIMAPTRYEWALVEMAVLYAGAVVVPLYETSAPAQVAAVFDLVQPVLVVAAGADQVVALKAAGVSVPILTMDTSGDDLDTLAESGESVPDRVLEQRRSLAGPDDVASIMFTSGTSTSHRGVRITHGNLVRQTLNISREYAEVFSDHAVTIVALPLAHILARGLQLIALSQGVTLVHEGDPAHVLQTFEEVRPTFLVVVPRLLEKVLDAERDRAATAGLSTLFARAQRVAVSWGTMLERRQDDSLVQPTPWLRLQHGVFDRLFYRRLRAHLGGRVAWVLCGAAPLDPALARCFWGQGVPILEGYGLTESTATATGNRPDDIRPGTVGRPMPGTTIRIDDDGEVLVAGVGVTPGYVEGGEDSWRDGFLRTGDLGSLDDKGRLTVQGLIGSAIVTTWGKKVAPARWELEVEKSRLVARALMVGDGRPYLSVLLLLDREAVIEWAVHHGHPGLATRLRRTPPTPDGVPVTDAALVHRLGRDVDRANNAVSRSEQVRKILPLVADLTPGGTIITPTLKLRREAFLAAAAHHIEALYASG
ncbi:MAG TPA: AMP-binding protein [Propionibacteriaceae bacterium]|nr:AMP-binding protein [Propionibacteriaceae bacterium]